MGFALTIIVLVVTLGIAWRYLGSYMAAVFDGRVRYLAWAERPVYRLLGTDPEQEQSWKRYAGSAVIFSALFLGVGYLLIRIQGSLPLNPQHLGAVTPALSWNTSVSFLTNTNWQNYGGETTMSYFSQIGVLTVQQFVSAAVGIAVAIALTRGFVRRSSPTIGNFWVDITRCLLYILLPIAFLAGIVIVGQGAVQTLAGPVTIHNSPQRRHPDHPSRAGGIHGLHHAVRNQRRRVLQRRPGPPLREPDRDHQPALHLAHPVHPLRPDLHLRQDGGQHPPRRRPAGRHGADLRGVGGFHQLRRASGQPGRRNCRPDDAHTQHHSDLDRQHERQRGPFR